MEVSHTDDGEPSFFSFPNPPMPRSSSEKTGRLVPQEPESPETFLICWSSRWVLWYPSRPSQDSGGGCVFASPLPSFHLPGREIGLDFFPCFVLFFVPFADLESFLSLSSGVGRVGRGGRGSERRGGERENRGAKERWMAHALFSLHLAMSEFSHFGRASSCTSEAGLGLG